MNVISDPVSYVRGRPDLFLDPNIPRDIGLVKWLLTDILVLGGQEICVKRYEDWWLVGSSMDWLRPPVGLSLQDMFSRIIPLPQAGDNSMRSEILLAAFCEEVVVLGPDSDLTIKGKSGKIEEIRSFVSTACPLERVVAFRIQS
jgi:hypothetical protein